MDEKIAIRLNKTRKEDFLTWLVNELQPSGWFNSFLTTDEEGSEYNVTLQSPFLQDDTLEIQATAVNSDGSLSDWGSVIKFQCFQLSNDVLRLEIEYKKYPGITEYFNTILNSIQVNFLGETRPETKDEDKYTFQKLGGGWLIVFEGNPYTFKNYSGLEYIQALLRKPDQEIAAPDLEINSRMEFPSGENDVEVLSDGGFNAWPDEYEMIDDQAVKELNERIEELELLLEDARENGGETERLEESLSQSIPSPISLKGQAF